MWTIENHLKDDTHTFIPSGGGGGGVSVWQFNISYKPNY